MSSLAGPDRSQGGRWYRRAGTGSALAALALLSIGLRGDAAAQQRSEDSVARLAPGRFLVASRELGDPNFRRTVVLLVDYDRREGALGLVINRPSEVDLASILSGAKDSERALGPVFLGGPVAPLQFAFLVRSGTPPEGGQRVLDDVFFSTNLDLLERLAAAEESEAPFRAYAGYAGWSIGQLEAEVHLGGWHVVEGRAETIFDPRADEVWPRLILVGTAEWARLDGGRTAAVGERS